MAKIIRARHIGFTPGGMPIVAPMPNAACASSLPDDISARQIDFVPDGSKPILAYAWECCDAICPDDLENTTDPCYVSAPSPGCYVQADCWPVGEGPGILRKAIVYLFDVSNCYSVRGLSAVMCYLDDDAAWYGSVSLRGGTLDLKFECLAGDPGDPGKFKLSWTGCATGNLTAGYTCDDPLIIDFGQATFEDCCDCNQSGPGGTTDVAPQINFTLATNCRRTVVARHISYARRPCDAGTCRYQWSAAGQAWGFLDDTCSATDCESCPPQPVDQTAGTVNGEVREQPCIPVVYPVVARSRPCNWDQVGAACGTMRCPLVATVTNVSGCGCMAGTYDVEYSSGGWHYAGGWPDCPASGQMDLSCVDNGDGTVTLSLDVVCGADNIGSAAPITIAAEDMDDLDVTFAVTMSDPSALACAGNCRWVYNAMSATWTESGSTCSANCEACQNAPASPPGSPTDGQVVTEPCTPSNPPDCCVGTISVRFQR